MKALGIRRRTTFDAGVSVAPLEVECFIEAFRADSGGQPYTLADMQTAVAGDPERYAAAAYRSVLDEDSYRNFEFGVTAWMEDTPINTVTYGAFLGGLVDDGLSRSGSEIIYAGPFCIFPLLLTDIVYPLETRPLSVFTKQPCVVHVLVLPQQRLTLLVGIASIHHPDWSACDFFGGLFR